MTFDSGATIMSLITIFGTVVGLAVWMVKQSAKRNESVTDRFIKYMEDAAATRATERDRDSAERTREREEFLQGLRDNNDATRSLAEAVRDLSHSVEKQSSRLEEVEALVGKRAARTVERQVNRIG